MFGIERKKMSVDLIDQLAALDNETPKVTCRESIP